MIEQKSTKQILAESLAQLMQTDSIEHITVSDIVKNCRLTRRTFYNNFKDKYEVIEYIYKEQTINYLSLIGQNETWYSAILNKLKIIWNNRTFYSKVYCQKMFLDSFQKITKDMHMDLISQYCEIDSELEFLIDFYCCGCVSKTAIWIKTGFKDSPEEMICSFIECLPEKLKQIFYNNKDEILPPFVTL